MGGGGVGVVEVEGVGGFPVVGCQAFMVNNYHTRQIVKYWDSRVTMYLYIPGNETSNFAGFDGIE